MKERFFAPKPTPEVSIQWSSDSQNPLIWGLGSPPYGTPSESDPILRYVNYGASELDDNFEDAIAPRPSGDNAVFVVDINSEVVFTAHQNFQDTKCFPVFWEWSFGDGFRAYGEQVSHTYSILAPEGVQAVLTVTDNKGRKWRARQQMYVVVPSVMPVLIAPDSLVVVS
jgi:hypothetical protein